MGGSYRTVRDVSRWLAPPSRDIQETSSLQGELILGMAYGYEVHGHDDGLLRASTRRIRFATEKILPGTLLINYIPLCMYFFLFLFTDY